MEQKEKTKRYMTKECMTEKRIEANGTRELRTEHLILRRYRPEDADALYQYLGTDPAMVKYSGWNPYATPEMAEDTVRRFIDSYKNDHVYSWVIDSEGVLVGTIGAYDYKDSQIEVGISIIRDCWGCGYATEALKAVLAYLTENESISCVTAWCAAENIGSRKVLEKAGMRFMRSEEEGLIVGDKIYEKLYYEYRKRNDTDKAYSG